MNDKMNDKQGTVWASRQISLDTLLLQSHLPGTAQVEQRGGAQMQSLEICGCRAPVGTEGWWAPVGKGGRWALLGTEGHRELSCSRVAGLSTPARDQGPVFPPCPDLGRPAPTQGSRGRGETDVYAVLGRVPCRFQGACLLEMEVL